MTLFTYEAMDEEGKYLKDTIEAESSEKAIFLIREKGYFPTSVRPSVKKYDDRKENINRYVKSDLFENSSKFFTVYSFFTFFVGFFAGFCFAAVIFKNW